MTTKINYKKVSSKMYTKKHLNQEAKKLSKQYLPKIELKMF